MTPKQALQEAITPAKDRRAHLISMLPHSCEPKRGRTKLGRLEDEDVVNIFNEAKAMKQTAQVLGYIKSRIDRNGL